MLINTLFLVAQLPLAISPLSISPLAISSLSMAQSSDGPSEVTWPEFRESTFDTAWALPEQGPWSDREDLIGVMKRFVGLKVQGRSDDPVALGDIVVGLRGYDRRPQFSSQLRRLKAGFPEVFDEVDQTLPELDRVLSELICDRAWQSSSWDPDVDSAEDGILLWGALDARQLKSYPWDRLSGSHLFQQAAVLVFADIPTIKEAEGNYPAYPARTGATYEAIYPRRGSRVAGERPDGSSFQGLKVYFRAKLPIPFMTYSCDLRIYEHLDGAGNLVTNIYSPSSDFHWMAGRDVYLPVRKGTGEWVGTIVVRQFGFDLDDLPDDDSDRQAAIRSTLGNLRREAEALFSKRSSDPVEVVAPLPSFEIRGWR